MFQSDNLEDSLGFYRFEYDNGMTQTKELITQKSFEWYKWLSNFKSDVEVKIKGKKKEKIDPADLTALKEVKETLKTYFPYSHFVVGSPMYKAIETGIIDISDPTCGNYGQYPCKVTKVEAAEAVGEDEE